MRVPVPNGPQPENLFVEVRDMAEVSFLIYSFAYLLAAARVLSDENRDHQDLKTKLFQLQSFVDANGNSTEQSNLATTVFTPKSIQTIIKNNQAALVELQKEEKLASAWDADAVLQMLDNLQKRVPKNNPTALSLVQYDDVFQQDELVYAIGKDDVNRRITLVFRGTESSNLLGSASYNWKSNLQVQKTKIHPLPEVLKPLLKEDGIERVWVHSGFYNAMMKQTKTTADSPLTTKYQQILETVQRSLKAHPGYQLYITGHSLGGALSTLFAFFLACEPSLPKPVVCCNYASPRVGDSYFLRACQALERKSLLRMFRVINDKDSVAVIPSFNYSHVGFQIRMPVQDDDESKPELTYPKLTDSWWNRFGRAWGNSVVSSFNLSYDHGDYSKRIFIKQKELESFPNIGELYRTKTNLTGFEV